MYAFVQPEKQLFVPKIFGSLLKFYPKMGPDAKATLKYIARKIH